MGEETDEMTKQQRITEEQAAAFMPDGLRDRVSVHAAQNALSTSYMASAFSNARRGIPTTFQQEERWKRLGLA